MGVYDKTVELLRTVELQKRLLEQYRLYVAVLELKSHVESEAKQHDTKDTEG